MRVVLEMCRYCGNTEDCYCCDDLDHWIRERLENYKPVKYGIWKPYKTPLDTRQTGWICTNCSGVHFGKKDGDTDYCPHCGAVMDRED